VAFVGSLAAQDLPSSGNKPATPGISLTINPVDDVVKPGAPVEIKLNLKNPDLGNVPIALRFGTRAEQFRQKLNLGLCLTAMSRKRTGKSQA
jgi:hypothetical protein